MLVYHRDIGPEILVLSGVLIWCYGATVGARTTYSGIRHEISGARAW